MTEKHGQHGISRLNGHSVLHRGDSLIEPVGIRQGEGVVKVDPRHVRPSGEGLLKGVERLVKLIVCRELLALDKEPRGSHAGSPS